MRPSQQPSTRFGLLQNSASWCFATRLIPHREHHRKIHVRVLVATMCLLADLYSPEAANLRWHKDLIYLCRIQDPLREYDDLEGDIELGIFEQLAPSGKDAQKRGSEKGSGPKEGRVRGNRKQAKAEARNPDLEQMQENVDGHPEDIENDKQRLKDIAPEFRGTEYEPGADIEAHAIQKDGVILEDTDRKTGVTVTRKR